MTGRWFQLVAQRDSVSLKLGKRIQLQWFWFLCHVVLNFSFCMQLLPETFLFSCRVENVASIFLFCARRALAWKCLWRFARLDWNTTTRPLLAFPTWFASVLKIVCQVPRHGVISDGILNSASVPLKSMPHLGLKVVKASFMKNLTQQGMSLQLNPLLSRFVTAALAWRKMGQHASVESAFSAAGPPFVSALKMQG